MAVGDRILVHLENCPEFLIVWCAIAELGAIAVTTNTRSSVPELDYYIEHSGCSGAITQPSLLACVAEAGRNLGWIVTTEYDAGQSPAKGSQPGTIDSFSALIARDPLKPRRQAAADPRRPIAVQYTSGTTSRPKGVVITHGNALWAGRVSSAHEALLREDVHLIYAPLFHVNALGYSFLPALWVGASVVLQPRFSKSRFWRTACDHRATWGSMIIFAVRALTEVENPTWQPFRCWGGAGANALLAQKIGVHMLGWYGMTETISHPICGYPDLPNRTDFIGRPAPEYGVRIVDANDSPSPFGETGLLKVRGVMGVSLFGGYLNDEAATKNAFDENGWFITGDRVVPYEDGSIRFAERDKDMLKVGGENVASSEVERVIAAIEGIIEVAVVGKPHPMLDEVPVAFIRLSPDVPDDARSMLIERVHAACASALADFKRPHDLIIIDEFPRAVLDKIAKAQLRARLIA
ncbi:AMP-dependent synthetase and ligase [Methylocella tundrae]|nr:AMP-dependent synthetase and ligase [Methylocella tundrae]